MPKESGKKMQELLRVLFLEAGAHSRSSLAARLGVSTATLDLSIRELREVFASTRKEILVEGRNRFKVTQFRFEQFRRCRNFLAALYRTRSVRVQERARLVEILKALAKRPHTRGQLRKIIDETDHANEVCCDEKTLSSYLQQLIQTGVIVFRRQGGRAQYELQTGLFRPDNPADLLTPEELLDLRDYVEYAAAVGVMSVPGHMLLETLHQYLPSVAGALPRPMFSFKYNLIGRVLDEYVAADLLEAINNRQKIRIDYLSRQNDARYEAANTPRFQKKCEKSIRFDLIPLRVVFDHQYGRWYMVGFDEGNQKQITCRVENIQTLAGTGEVIEAARLAELTAQVDKDLARSWVVHEPTNPTKIQLRFSLRSSADQRENFIRNRVQREACWGIISEESDSAFVFEITVNGYYEIKPWIRSFGSSVEVLAPPELRREIAEEWRQIGETYETV